jgi:hypothetical protein
MIIAQEILQMHVVEYFVIYMSMNMEPSAEFEVAPIKNLNKHKLVNSTN